MLDLKQIKNDLEAATSWKASGDSGEFHRKATEYVFALVAEVERLREAIQSHLETYAAERTDNYEASSTALYESYLKLWDAFDA